MNGSECLSGAGQPTPNRLEDVWFLDGEDGPTVPLEIRVVDEGGIARVRFRVDRLGGGVLDAWHRPIRSRKICCLPASPGAL